MSDLREKMLALILQSVWSPAAGPVQWDDDKIARAKVNAADLCDSLLALLPPAPDGATEGWKLVKFFNSPEGYSWGREGDIAGWTPAETAIAIMRRGAASPTVSPVGPNPMTHAAPAMLEELFTACGGKDAPLSHDPITISANLAHGLLATLGGVIGASNPSSQPTQTGEEPQWLEEAAEITPKAWAALENAGLVEEARRARQSVTQVLNTFSGGENSRLLVDLDEIIRRLAEALASRSPIPGELKALSDAAPPGPWRAGDITMAEERYIIANDAVVATRASVDSAAFIVACERYVRQALAKVAEGGVASAADSA